MVTLLRNASANGRVATVPMINEIVTTLTVRGDYAIAVRRRTLCEISLPQAILSLPAGLAFCICSCSLKEFSCLLPISGSSNRAIPKLLLWMARAR
jgi:hypothetical protein